MNTMIVLARLGRISLNMIRSRAETLLARGVDELALAQRQHLGADRLRDVRDVDEADHERRDEQRRAVERPDARATASTVPSAIPSSTAG